MTPRPEPWCDLYRGQVRTCSLKAKVHRGSMKGRKAPNHPRQDIQLLCIRSKYDELVHSTHLLLAQLHAVKWQYFQWIDCFIG